MEKYEWILNVEKGMKAPKKQKFCRNEHGK